MGSMRPICCRLRPLALALLLLISAIPSRAEESPPSDEAVTARLATYLDAAAAEGFTGVVLVARSGKVLLERGYGQRVPGGAEPVATDTVFPIGSITKQLTGAAVLVLEQQGKLRVEDTLGKWFPHAPADKREITIHQLLTHQAGFPGAIGDDVERIGRDAFVLQAFATPLQSPPGTRYEYSNVGFSLAAAIVELASGQGYETFLAEHLFAPAGMKETGYHLPRFAARRLAHGTRDDGGDWGTLADRQFTGGGPGWHLLGNGGVLSTASDMYRWHRALAGDAILTPASKAKLYGKHVDEGGGTWYGYGWSIEPTPWGEVITHNGGNRIFFADLLRFPAADVVVYLATSSRDRRMTRLGSPLASLVFTGEAPPLPPRDEALRAPGSEPAPAGSPAARWGLPGTPAGDRAAALLDALAAGDDAARARFADEGFAPALLARRGRDGLLAMLARMRGDLGTFTVRGYRTGEKGGIVVVLAPGSIPAAMKIELEVEAAPPHRIAGMGVVLGD
jgi:CubicO group peptidase (beta-lactamase class C family)